MHSDVVITLRTLTLFPLWGDGRRRGEEGLAQGRMAERAPLETRERIPGIGVAGNSHLIPES